MLSQCILQFILLTSFTANAIRERPIFVRIGEEINFCCEMDHQENMAVILNQGNTRLRSLVRSLQYKQFSTNSQEFFHNHPGFTMKDVSEPVESLCLRKSNPGAEISDDYLEFTCELISDNGLGAIVDREVVVIRIFEPPVIQPLSPYLETVVDGPVSVKCSATGRPDLRLRWINDNTKVVYAEQGAAEPNEGSLELQITLDKVTAEEDGQKLICEAYTSYPESGRPAQQFTEISVSYPPSITYAVNPIYTSLGAKEDIVVSVHGKPKPELVCDLIGLSGSRELIETPGESPSVTTYTLRINGIMKEDLGSHGCSARNKYGTDTKDIIITRAPSKPEVISPSFAAHADYYLLGWRSRSKSPLHNVTLKIQAVSGDASGNVEETREETRTIVLSDPMVAKVNTTSPEESEFWHHVANLTQGTEHKVYIEACNAFECHKSDSDKPDVVFRTNEGRSNGIDPKVLKQPPTAELRAAALEGRLKTDGTLATTTASLATMLSLAFLVIHL